jgi:hypothetical protein
MRARPGPFPERTQNLFRMPALQNDHRPAQRPRRTDPGSVLERTRSVSPGVGDPRGNGKTKPNPGGAVRRPGAVTERTQWRFGGLGLKKSATFLAYRLSPNEPSASLVRLRSGIVAGSDLDRPGVPWAGRSPNEPSRGGRMSRDGGGLVTEQSDRGAARTAFGPGRRVARGEGLTRNSCGRATRTAGGPGRPGGPGPHGRVGAGPTRVVRLRPSSNPARPEVPERQA